MRPTVRALVGIAAVALSLPSLATSPWRIGDGHSLIWQDHPYTPVGLRIDGTPAEIEKAAADGFHDLCVGLPVDGDGWSDAFTALQKHKMSFLVDINSLATFADGYSVEPEGFRLTQLKEGVPVSLTIPGATSMLAVIAASRDGEILKITRIKTQDGHVSIDIPADLEDDAVLILYPRMQSPDLPDVFEGLDKQRDRLLETLKAQKNTTGLRGIVNPLGRVIKLPSPDVHFVPSSAYYRIELARLLEIKYRSLETAEQAWSMRSSDIDTFDKLAALVPLWSGDRGLLDLWDPATDKLYPIDSRRSLAWTDIQDVLNNAARRRTRFLTEAIHSLIQVPVVQEWAGWSVPYEGGAMVDGVGMQTRGTQPSDLMEGASRAASTVLRWTKPGWLLATRMDLTNSKPDAVEGAVEDLMSVGARGVFARTDDPAVRKALLAISERFRATPMADDPVKAFYYPEDATFPAEPQRLPGGIWWLPAPFSGNRVELGSKVQAYRLNDGRGDKYVYWVENGTLPVRLLINEPKAVTIASVDGTPLTPHYLRDGVDVTLSTTPIVISGASDIPIPNVSKEELVDRFAKLVLYAGTIHADLTQPAVIFQNDLAGFDRSPGGSYTAMFNQYIQVARRLSPYSWVEGESDDSGTLGERVFLPGCSMDSAYRMQTKLGIPGKQYSVSYTIQPRSQNDQEVWLAARIPESLKSSVRVVIGTQVFDLPDLAVCPYGLGFAWYHLGTTKLGSDPVVININVDGSTGFEMAIDAIMITPAAFTPFGVRMPDPIHFVETRPKKK